MPNKECKEQKEQEEEEISNTNDASEENQHRKYCKSSESSVVVFSPTSQHDKEAVESTHSSKYRILCPIGHGSFGSVYLVEHKQTGCTFALKYIVCANDTRRSAALREVETMNAVQGHPNIIKIIDMFMNYEFYSISAVGAHDSNANLFKEKRKQVLDKSINSAEHNHAPLPASSKEQKEISLTNGIADNNVKISVIDGENKKKGSVAHWAHLRLPVNQAHTAKLSQNEQEKVELQEFDQMVAPAAEQLVNVQTNTGNSKNFGDDNNKNELFMSSKLLSEADTECLMREAELVLRNTQNNVYHFNKTKDVNTGRPRKAEELVLLLTHTDARHLPEEPYNNQVETNKDNKNSCTRKNNNNHLKENCAEAKVTPEENDAKLMVAAEEEVKQREELINVRKECDNFVGNSKSESKSTSESNNSRQLLTQRARDIKWKTKLCHGAIIAPPPTSYAPRRVRYVDFTYPTLAFNAQSNNNNYNSNSNQEIIKESVNDHAFKDRIAGVVEQDYQLEKKNGLEESNLACNKNNNVNTEHINKLSGTVYCNGDSNNEDVVELMSTCVPHTTATHSQNYLAYCGTNANTGPSQNTAITHYRNFATHKLSTRDSSSKSNQTTNCTSQSEEVTKQKRVISKQAKESPHLSFFHSSALPGGTSMHHTAQTTQTSSNKILDLNVIANTATSDHSNKTNTTNTTSNTKKTVSTLDSQVKWSRHDESQSTLQHNKISRYTTTNNNNNNYNNNESSAKVSSNVANKHPGCLCLVMEYHPLGDLAHYVLRQRELMYEGHEAVEKINALTEPQLLSVAYQLSSVLQYLHSRNPVIIHRDLKPENILIKGDAVELLSSTEQNQIDVPSLSLVSGRIKEKIIPIVVTDFGLAITQEYSEESEELEEEQEEMQ